VIRVAGDVRGLRFFPGRLKSRPPLIVPGANSRPEPCGLFSQLTTKLAREKLDLIAVKSEASISER
jgi:hypothetical protein